MRGSPTSQAISDLFSTEISAAQPVRVTVNDETPKTSAGCSTGYGSSHPSCAVWGGALTVAGTVTPPSLDAQPAAATVTSVSNRKADRARRMVVMLAQSRR